MFLIYAEVIEIYISLNNIMLLYVHLVCYFLLLLVCLQLPATLKSAVINIPVKCFFRATTGSGLLPCRVYAYLTDQIASPDCWLGCTTILIFFFFFCNSGGYKVVFSLSFFFFLIRSIADHCFIYLFLSFPFC